MSLVPSLLQAIVTTDGEALVLHVGEKPYVVTPTGQVDLATRGLTFDAVNGIVNELLPIESQRALDEFGAAQYELPPIVEFPGECFTVVAARGGEDLWAEIRRKSVPDEDRVPAELFGSVASETVEEVAPPEASADLAVPDASQLWPSAAKTTQPPVAARVETPSAKPLAARPAQTASEPRALPLIPPPPPDASPEAVATVAAKLQPAPPVVPAVETPKPAPKPAVAPVAPASVAIPAPASKPAPVVVPAPAAVVTPPRAPVVTPPPAAVVAPPPAAVVTPPPAAVVAPPPAAVVTPPPAAVVAPPPAAVVTPPPAAVVMPPPAPVAAPPPPAPVATQTPAPVAMPSPAPVVMPAPVPFVVPAPAAVAPPQFAAPVMPESAPASPYAAMPSFAPPPAPFIAPPAPVQSPAPSFAMPPVSPQISMPPLTPTAPSYAVPLPGWAVAPPSAPTPPAVGQRPSSTYLPPSMVQPAVVLPLARNPIRPDVPPRIANDALAGLDTLLRVAVARGASTLYLSSASRPSIRVDGDIYTIDGAPVLGPNDVEALVLTLMPERNAEALRTGQTSEWICDVPDVGRVRCMSFRDHRGPGGVFRLMPSRAATAEQLGLSREIQALAIEPEGLLLVAGPRSSGKRTLITGLVDLVNRMRRDHVITIEREITSVHDRIGSFISQREVRGGTEEMLDVARAALREDPDVLVLEEVRTPGLMNLALEAAASGQLVVGGFPAPNATGAIDRVIDLYPPEYRRQVQLSLAQNLRGVVAQVLLRKTTGGRVAAREVLLNTPAVRSVLAEGKTSQLPLAIEGGRPYGMSPLNDALVGYVQNGVVDVREAYYRAADRTGFLTLLKRHGLDTSLIERPA